jgi:hypothetical protein
MKTRRAISSLAITAFLAGLSSTVAGAQGTIETHKGPPPAPNEAAPESAPPPSPGRPPLEPAPGKPTLEPGPGVVDERGRGGLPARQTILGLPPILLLGLSVIGVLILTVAGLWRKSR